jgi:hypothetical protein
MSKEMLRKKLNGDQGLGPGSPPIVIGTSKNRREGLILVLLIAVGVGLLALTTIVLLPYVNSPTDNIFGGVGSSSTTDSGGSGAIEARSALTPSFKVTDANGNVIQISNGLAKPELITISGYTDSTYSTRLECSIDTLPVYCDGSPISLPGLPHGKHTFTISEPSNGETTVRVLSWKSIP